MLRRGPLLRGCESGFTLIEILVALTIMAVLSSMIAISVLPSDAETADKEARRLAALLEMASSETRASGQIIAWSPDEGGYSFWRRSEEGEWVRFPDSSAYRRRWFGGQTELRNVLVGGRPLPPDDRITISPYRTRDLFEMTVAGGNAQITLRGGVLGRISLQRNTDGKAVGDGTAARPWIYAG